jgi:hypothetical protein
VTRAETYAAIHGAPLPIEGFFSRTPAYGRAFQAVGEERRKFVAAIELALALRNNHPSLPKACGVLDTINARLLQWLTEWQPTEEEKQ